MCLIKYALLEHGMKWLLLALLQVMLTGCVGSIVIKTMEPKWEPAVLSKKEGCPNLDGVYHSMAVHEEGLEAYEKGLISIAAPFERGRYERTMFNEELYFKSLHKNRQFLVTIRHVGEEIQVSEMYDLGNPFVTYTVKLDGKLNGCYNNALLIRKVYPYRGGNEWGHAFYREKESEVRKLSDGSIQIEERLVVWDGLVTVSREESVKKRIYKPYN